MFNYAAAIWHTFIYMFNLHFIHQFTEFSFVNEFQLSTENFVEKKDENVKKADESKKK